MANRLVNLPNMLSIARIVVLPLLAVCIVRGQGVAACVILILAGITDILDGWIARQYKQETPFGKLLDPVADKLLLCVGIIFLLARPETYIGPTLATLLLAREFLVTGLRAMAASEGLVLGADSTGKFKTFGQFIGLGALMLIGQIDALPVREIGLSALWLSVVLSYISMVQYIRKVYFALREKLT